MVTRVTLQHTGLVCRKIGSRLRGTFAVGGGVLLAVSCSVDSKEGYKFGEQGGNAGTSGTATSGGAPASGGHTGTGGANAAGGGFGGHIDGGAAGALQAGEAGGPDVDGSGGGSVAGSGSQGGVAGLSGSGGSAGGVSGSTGMAGVGGGEGDTCVDVKCPGGFACANGACKTSCAEPSDCASGWFCEASSCHLHALDVQLGSSHSCALVSDGSVRCWGANESRQLGAASTGPRSARPLVVNAVNGAVQLAAGAQHTCALLTDGSVVCWGSNAQGSLGNPNLAEGALSPDPVVVALPSAAASISATCAVLKTGALWCWGTNIYSELADSTLGTQSLKPVRIGGLSGVTQVSAGPCAIASSTLYCWGNNSDGQCGSGTMPSTVQSPTPVNDVAMATLVSAGSTHACAIVSGGAARCWGANSDGELGIGTTGDRAWSGVPVQGLSSGVTSISTGGFHTCASLVSGAAFCWGRGGSGELGTGTMLGANVPTPVSGLSGVSRIVAGFEHSCAIKNDGSLWCWGSGSFGQIGTLWTNSASPVQIIF